MARDDFSANTKRRLAQRAGYQCSICDALTIGPSNEKDDSVNITGVAAHISGASEGRGSRRYNPTMTPEERSSINNGIWLCSSHADLIDGDESTYTIESLKFTKNNHERRIKLKQSGINLENGIITGIEVSNLGEISETVEMTFSDRNLILGDNGSGKTMICEFISSLSNKDNLKRWLERYDQTNATFSIDYFRFNHDKFTISIDPDNKVSYFHNNNPIPILKSPLEVLFLKDSFSDFKNKLEDKDKKTFIEVLGMYFGLDLDEIMNVLSITMKERKFIISDLRFNKDRTSVIAKISSGPHSHAFEYEQLSGGEQQRVILEVALKWAYYYSRFRSTILLIEYSSFDIIDTAGINRLFEVIRNGNFNFQFFFTSIKGFDFDTSGFTTWTLEPSSKGDIVARRG